MEWNPEALTNNYQWWLQEPFIWYYYEETPKIKITFIPWNGKSEENNSYLQWYGKDMGF